MRAFDIMLFCICVNLAIGLVNVVVQEEGQKSYYQEQTGEGWTHNVSEVSEMTSTNMTPISGTLELTKWMIGGIFFVIQLLGSIVWIYPALVDTFGIPAAISAVLQTLIWIMYSIGIVQLVMNRDIRAYQ